MNFQRNQKFWTLHYNMFIFYVRQFCQSNNFSLILNRRPETCNSSNETGVEYHSRMMGYPKKMNMQNSAYVCRRKTMLRVSYKIDPNLTMMLSMVSCDHCFIIHYVSAFIQDYSLLLSRSQYRDRLRAISKLNSCEFLKKNENVFKFVLVTMGTNGQILFQEYSSKTETKKQNKKLSIHVSLVVQFNFQSITSSLCV